MAVIAEGTNISRRMHVDDLYAFAIPEQVALAPDGVRIAYVVRTPDKARDQDRLTLWSHDGSDGARQLTQGPSDSAPSWSPDGRSLAFLRAEDGIPQIWLLPIGGVPERLTNLALGAGVPEWSPDGHRIAFTAPVTRPGRFIAETADRSRAASPVVIDDLDYQAGGRGFVNRIHDHIHVVDLATQAVAQLTDGDQSYGNPAWSPDGSHLAFPGTIGRDPDLTGHTAAWLLNLAVGAGSLRPVGPVTGSIEYVTWATDGHSLIAVGRADTESGHAHLWSFSIDREDVVDLTQALDRNVMLGATAYPGGAPKPTPDGRFVLFCARDRGCTHLYRVGVGGGASDLLLGGSDRVVSGLSVSGNGKVAVVLVTPSSYGEIVILDVEGNDQNHLPQHGTLPSDVVLWERSRRVFVISDGTQVEGWLVHDSNIQGPRPLLLDIHGGPHNAWNGAADPVHIYHQVLASRGWVILLLNPRGSDGYGEEFFNAVVGAWGSADMNDFLEPVDELVNEGMADPERLTVAGYSYGGYMTCHLVGHDQRFAAAVAGGPVTDLISLAGTADNGHYVSTTELASTWWLDPDRFREMSPLTHGSHVRTPTLVLQGTADVRCPPGQAQQWFAVLRERQIPTRLVLYPDASHTFIVEGRPSHRADYNNRVVEWVERFAGAEVAR